MGVYINGFTKAGLGQGGQPLFMASVVFQSRLHGMSEVVCTTVPGPPGIVHRSPASQQEAAGCLVEEGIQ